MVSSTTLIVLGRVILGLFFVIAGLRNFAGFASRRTPETNYGWPLPAYMTAAGYAAQIVGGLSVTLGVAAQWGASLLILFLIGATALFHNFTLFTGEARQPHLYFTLVNAALIGYCLMVIGTAA